MLSIIIPCKNEKNIVDMIVETEKCFPEAQIIISSDRYGYGKGWALSRGVEEAKGDLICFIDGDLDINPKEINKLLTEIVDNDIVVGRKKLSGGLSRMIITFCSRIFIYLLFNLKIDTQTGVKVFKKEALPKWENKSFAFDIEILHKAVKNGAKIKEVPVEVSIKNKMPLRSILRFIRGAIQIKLQCT